MSLTRVNSNIFYDPKKAVTNQTAAVKKIFADAKANGWELSNDNFQFISIYQKKLNDTNLQEQVISHFRDICDAVILSDETAYKAKYLQLFSQIIELFPQVLKGKASEFYPDSSVQSMTPQAS